MSTRSFIDALRVRLDLPTHAPAFPAGTDAFARAAEAFVDAAKVAFDVPLRLDSEKLLAPWPKGFEQTDGTCSLDAFASAHLTIPEMGRWYDGATLRDPDSDDEAEAYAALEAAADIIDCPLVVYALGATLATFYARHAQARWIGAATVDPLLEAPPGMTIGGAGVVFPFQAARTKMASPRDMLWSKRFTLMDAPPPRAIAGTYEEAQGAWAALLPPGAADVLDAWEARGPADVVNTLLPVMDAHPDNALLVRSLLPISGRVEDGYATLEQLSRRLLKAHPHYTTRYGLADVLSCMDGRHAEAEALFREVLAEQSMMTRARLKLGALLVEIGRKDEGVTELLEVAGSWGDEADQAKAWLADLGVAVPEDGVES